MMAAIAVGLILACPSRRTAVNFAHIIIAFGALVLTFSKASIIVSLLMCIIHGLRYRRIPLILGPIVIVLGIFLFADAVVHSELFELSPNQEQRIVDLERLMRGDLDSETTTGRTIIWELGIQRMEEVFPGGAGICKFHELVGGIMEGDVWLGVHNTYLMVLGEAGVLAFLFFLGANVVLTWRAYRCKLSSFALMYVILLQANMFDTQSVLIFRVDNVATGLVLGLIGWSRLHRPAPYSGSGRSGG